MASKSQAYSQKWAKIELVRDFMPVDDLLIKNRYICLWETKWQVSLT